MVRIVPLAERHRADWERLFAGYAAYYKVAQTPEMRARVWGWIDDPAHEVEALVAEALEDGRAVGVRLHGGEEIGAEVVVSAADYKLTWAELVGDEHLTRRLRRKLASLEMTLPMFAVYVALDAG